MFNFLEIFKKTEFLRLTDILSFLYLITFFKFDRFFEFHFESQETETDVEIQKNSVKLQ